MILLIAGYFVVKIQNLDTLAAAAPVAATTDLLTTPVTGTIRCFGT